jgi:uncharacterized protein
MSVFLLDVNTLLALAWPTHVHHSIAHRWFAENHRQEWATCPLTQLGFVRLSLQPAVVKVPVLFADVVGALARITINPAHRFWPIDYGVTEIRDEIRTRLIGHNQVTDALLLDLAIRHQGRLATFDHRIGALLPPGSKSREALEIIPA